MKQPTFVITGASSGIGKAITKILAQRSYHLIIASRNLAALKVIQHELLAEYPCQITCLPVDYADSNSIDELMAYIYHENLTIDGFISCVGYGDFKAAVQTSYRDISHMFQVNTLGTMYVSNLMAQKMLDQGYGHISLLGSMSGKISTAHSSVYSASKFAIIGYANSLRLELMDRGVSVTTVNPGPVATSFFERNQGLKTYYQKVQRWTLPVEDVAIKIVDNMLRTHPRRELNLPMWMVLLTRAYNAAPRVGDIVLKTMVNFKEES